MNIDFSEARTLKRFPFLDAARGVACIGVVACHCDLAKYFHWYWGVMDFFFVMSGFLITRSLVTNCDRGRGTFAFFLYRALRLLPAYLTIMFLYELTVFLLGTKPPWETLPYLLFYQHTDMILGKVEIYPRVHEMIPYWSLVLEEHYYMFWGILFCTFAYARLRITPATIGGVALLLGCAILLRKIGVNWWTLPGRFDAFLLGSIAGITIFMPHKVNVSAQWTRWLIGIGSLLCLAALGRLVWSSLLSYRDLELYNKQQWLDVSCFSLVSLVLVLGMVKIDIRRLHFGPIQEGCAFIGLISYEIYLVHFPLVSILKKMFDFKFDNGGILLFVVTMVLSSAIAYLMHRTLTAPALKKREQILSFMSGKSRPKPAVIPPGEPSPVPVSCEEPAITGPARNP